MLHERDFPRGDLISELGVLDAIKIVDFNGVDVHTGKFPGRGEHVVVRFAGEPEHDVGADFKAPIPTAFDRIEKRIVVVPTVHPIE